VAVVLAFSTAALISSMAIAVLVQAADKIAILSVARVQFRRAETLAREGEGGMNLDYVTAR
jgi:hypothetical protein